MKAAAEKATGGLRQSMVWLHTWAGLGAGWVLFVIFLTGTLGVFDGAITRWMKPEQALQASLPAGIDRAALVRLAQRHFERVAPQGHFWSIGLPSEEEPVLRLFWEDAKKNFHSARLDPLTGQPMAKTHDRDTEGGHHFVHMHYEFQAGTAGFWLVGFCTMAMLVALVSGIITHKRIFKDFFTFRPKKGQRSWLDAHNAVAVLSLPFQLMIAYTGLVIFYGAYIPAGVRALYPSDEAFYAALQKEPAHREETHIAAPVVRLDTLLAQAEHTLQRQASFVVTDHPGDSSASVRVYGPFNEGEGEGRLRMLNGGQVLFDGVSGAVLHTDLPRSSTESAAQSTQQTMSAIHMANFGGLSIKWLYFLCGLAGTAMMATGSLLFMVKRRQKSLHEFGAATPRIYRLIEVLNVGVIAGLCVACIAFLWGNRLLPLEIAQRSGWEVGVFFGVWALALVHAAVRPARRAWIEQFGAAAVLCLALPLLNQATVGLGFISYLRRGDWQPAGVELSALAFAALFAAIAYVLATRPAHDSNAGRLSTLTMTENELAR